jgi:hypothetical protein
MLESPTWNLVITRLFKDKLDSMRSQLLTNQTLKEGDRVGYIQARGVIMKEFRALYGRYNLELPNWLEE